MVWSYLKTTHLLNICVCCLINADDGNRTLVLKLRLSDGENLRGIDYPYSTMEAANPGVWFQLNDDQFTIEQFRSESLDFISHHDNQMNRIEYKFHSVDKLVPLDVMLINSEGEFESIADHDEEIRSLLAP